MSVAIISAGVGVVSAGYSVYNSAHKASQAKKLAASNLRPIYKPDGSIQDVYNLNAQNIDDTRLLDYGTNEAQQGLSSGIDAILKSGGRADFQTINNNYGSELKSIIAQTDARRDARIATFNNAAYNKAQSSDAAFEYNQDAPFKDKKQQEAELRKESAQATADAITTAAGTVANYGTATNAPGQYGTSPNVARGNANVNSQLDNRLLIDAANPVPNANPDLIPNNPQRATGAGIPAGSSGTAGSKIIDFDEFGNPIYG